jgi:serine/threonine protein kinase
LPERTLRDRFLEGQVEGQPGIPRAELLGYLRTAAEALRDLFRHHAVQHLGLNPRNLFLDGGKLRLADFGLVQLLWLPAGQNAARLNARYSAPELLKGEVHPSCDQYSLALIYHEMLTGFPPAPAAAPGAALDLGRLPAADRDIIACALSPQPQRRWQGAVEMVEALEAVTAGGGVRELPVSETPETADLLHARFSTRLPAGVIRLRLDAFRQQWSGQVLRDEPAELWFGMKTPSSLWQRWLGRSPGVEVHCLLENPSPSALELSVSLRPQGTGRKQSAELRRVIGPLLLESLRTFLQVNAARRAHERLAWRHPLKARPVGADGSCGEPIEGRGKDISLNGIGFYLRQQASATQFQLQLPRTPQTPEMAVPVRVVRVQPSADGWYEVGAVLLPPGPGEADPKQLVSAGRQ